MNIKSDKISGLEQSPGKEWTGRLHESNLKQQKPAFFLLMSCTAVLIGDALRHSSHLSDNIFGLGFRCVF